MISSMRLAIGLACLALGLGLCVVSFTVRNDVIGWYSRSGLLFLVVGGVLLRLWLRRHDNLAPTETGEAQRKLLLMLLRRSPARLNAETLEAAARSAWENRFGRNHDGSDYVESGEEGFGFVVQAQGNAFLVIETQKGKRELKAPVHAEPDTAIGIWSEYSHELSVGVAYNYDTDVSRLCFFVANLVAALADGETLGLFHLDSGRLWRLEHEIVERLRSEPDWFFGFKQTK
jgi:hypothetical protein